jgi:hypothetical protein
MSRRQPRRIVPRIVVDGGEAAVVEIQPQLARQREPVVIGIGNAAAAFNDAQLRILVHAEGRKLEPVRRHVGLRRIDAVGPSAAAMRSWSLEAKLQISSRAHLPPLASGRTSVPATPVPRAVNIRV